ncbi:RM09 protein, partial [Origma solitaria]|nr:RM09 protein [Origma solitaria]
APLLTPNPPSPQTPCPAPDPNPDPDPTQTLQFLRRCRLEVGMKNNVHWELSPEIVARHFLKNLGVWVPPQALQLPPEPITRWGHFWCDVTV